MSIPFPGFQARSRSRPPRGMNDTDELMYAYERVPYIILSILEWEYPYYLCIHVYYAYTCVLCIVCILVIWILWIRLLLIKGLSKNHLPKGPCERPALRSSMASPGEILLVRAKGCGACPPSLLSAAGGFGEGDGFTASVLGQLDGSTGTLVVSLFF